MEEGLTHLNERGEMRMVDTTKKQPSERVAVARGKIHLNEKAYAAVKNNALEKGEALSAARLAGIMAAKNTAGLIPLCHPLRTGMVSVSFSFSDEERSIEAQATVRGYDVTGFEMEAMTAVAVSLLTIYDMAKALDKEMKITDIRLVYKSGGKSGTFKREGEKVEEDR